MGYAITGEYSFFDHKYGVTPALKVQLPNLYDLSVSGTVSDIPTFLALIERYPKNPQRKNLRSSLYNALGDF